MLKQKFKIKQLLLSSFGLVLLFSFSSNGKASSLSASQNTVTSYSASSTIDPGMIVELKSGSNDTVEPLKIQDINKMLGVVVQPNQASIVLTPSTSSTQQVYVANSGKYDVLVSDQNGPIKAGDSISISSIAGIGMEAQSSEAVIIGKALAAFNDKSASIGTAKISTSFSSSQLNIGLIPVSIGVSHNPSLSTQANYVPGSVSKVAATISDKPVSAFRVYISLLILIIAFFLAAILLYGGIKSGITAIGRNPLSKKSIVRGLIQTVITGLLVFAAGISAVYLILKL
jgi:hypothetical protein